MRLLLGIAVFAFVGCPPGNDDSTPKRIVKFEEYDASDVLQGTMVVQYDAGNRLLKIWAWDASGTIVEKTKTYSFDVNGRIIKSWHWDGDEEIVEKTSLFTYNAAQKISVVEKYEGDEDDYEGKSEFTWDGDDFMEQKSYNASGTLESTVLPFYDASGNMFKW